jgi:hypothetical protein
MTGSVWLLLVASETCPGGAVQNVRPADSRTSDFFEKKIRPLLADKCWRCHGPLQQKSELRLDAPEHLAAGGTLGTVVTPGIPDKSLLIQVVQQTGKLKMPPDEMLSAAQVAALQEWVRGGAIWPTTDDSLRPAQKTDEALFTPGEKAHWSFQPIRDPALPPVKDNETGTSRPGPVSPGRQTDPDSTSNIRPARPATHGRGNQQVPPGRVG